MRITSFFILFILTFSFVSCSSDDDNGNEATIYGYWDITEFTMNGEMHVEGVDITFEGIADDLEGNNTNFNEDNTLEGNNAPFDMVLTYNISGMTETIVQEMSSAMSHNGTWSRDGDILQIQENGSNEVHEFTIATLNATTLKLIGDETSIPVDNSFPPGSEFDVSLTFTR